MKEKKFFILAFMSLVLVINGSIGSKNLVKEDIVKTENQGKFTIEKKEADEKESAGVDENKTGNMTMVEPNILKLYQELGLENKLQYNIFATALKGMEIIAPPQKEYLTIIDFTQDSSKRRFFLLDLEKKEIIYNDFVAHGMKSGEKEAEYFSNEENSHQSSLGFYLTAETYYGSNGYSLRLDGLDKGLNDNARKRDIVMHGASYVSERSIEETGRIGRSWGCPALRPDITNEVIDKIQGGNLVFVYAKGYEEKSNIIGKY